MIAENDRTVRPVVVAACRGSGTAFVPTAFECSRSRPTTRHTVTVTVKLNAFRPQKIVMRVKERSGKCSGVPVTSDSVSVLVKSITKSESQNGRSSWVPNSDVDDENGERGKRGVGGECVKYSHVSFVDTDCIVRIVRRYRYRFSRAAISSGLRPMAKSGSESILESSDSVSVMIVKSIENSWSNTGRNC